MENFMSMAGSPAQIHLHRSLPVWLRWDSFISRSGLVLSCLFLSFCVWAGAKPRWLPAYWGGKCLRAFRWWEATTVTLLDLFAQLLSAVVYVTQKPSAAEQNLGSRSCSGDEADACLALSISCVFFPILWQSAALIFPLGLIVISRSVIFLKTHHDMYLCSVWTYSMAHYSVMSDPGRVWATTHPLTSSTTMKSLPSPELYRIRPSGLVVLNWKKRCMDA